MTDLTIPDDAEAILDRVIYNVDAICECSTSRRDFAKGITELLKLLPHKWCAIDPLIYDCYVYSREEKCCFVFARREQAPNKNDSGKTIPILDRWPSDMPIPESVMRFAIPSDLGSLFGTFVNLVPHFVELDVDFASEIIDSLSSLRSKIRLRQESLSTVAHDPPGEPVDHKIQVGSSDQLGVDHTGRIGQRLVERCS